MMKKMLLLFVCAVLCLFSGSCEKSLNVEFDPNNPETWFDETGGGQIDIRDIEQLQTGMSLDETIEILGKPKRDVGSGVVIMEWDMVSGTHLDVYFVEQTSNHSQNETTSGRLIIEKWKIEK